MSQSVRGNQPVQGSSVYETWVLTLRAWGKDPTVSLEHLPVITEEMYTPEVFARLINAIVDAMRKVTDIWMDALARVLHDVGDHRSFAAGLVELRSGLARRVQLATHPALPQVIRESLTDSARQDIGRYQDEVEEVLFNTRYRANISPTESDRLVAIARQHPFTAVFGMAVTYDGTRITSQAIPAMQSSRPAAPRATNRFAQRRLIPPPAQQ